MKEIYINNKNNYYQRFEVLKKNRNKRYKYNEEAPAVMAGALAFSLINRANLKIVELR